MNGMKFCVAYSLKVATPLGFMMLTIAASSRITQSGKMSSAVGSMLTSASSKHRRRSDLDPERRSPF